MKTSQAESLQRLSNALQNLSSARERLDKGGEIRSIKIEFKGKNEPKDAAHIAVENIVDFGSIKTQMVAALDDRIAGIKQEMRALLE